MGVDLPALRAFAEVLADEADALSMPRFRGPMAVDTKPDGTYVTEVDTAIEAALRDRIAAAWPDHEVLGEEEGGTLDPERPTWVIDPIDGTSSYLRGQPIWGTLVGLVHGGRSIVGSASLPALGERWSAAAGLGATRNGSPASVSGIRDLGDAQVLHGGLGWFRRDPALWEVLGSVADDAWRTRGVGDCWQHLLVAAGAAEVAFEVDLKIWDVAALACIVEEAGGTMTRFDGSSVLLGGSALTTNGLLHPELQARLTGVG